ncbi:MAG: LOG family protein [Planctomycetota bacterium]|nr:LOG family protein [Planctomycetota bacterium]
MKRPNTTSPTPPRSDDFSTNLEQTQESTESPRKPDLRHLATVRQLADQLVAALQSLPDGDLVAEIIDNALKLLRDRTNRGDIKLINKAMKEIRYALKIFAPYREIHKVSMFGSARTPESDPDYQQAADFAKGMVAAGWMVITGAGGGIMAAGHGGAGADPSFGLAIRLPHEQAANPTIAQDEKLINFKYFFTRKLIFVRAANALALFPGGFGTLDEGFEVLTLIQTGKSVPMPVVMIDHPGGTYWNDWLHYIQTDLLERHLISPSDLSLFKITNSNEEAIREITRFYNNYHSVRTVRHDLVIRLQRKPTPAQLAQINTRFTDLTDSQPFRVAGPLPEESDEPALAQLHRLVFPFNHHDHGRLRILIDFLNDLPETDQR